MLLKHCGASPVIVHGGGPHIASMLGRLNISTTAVDVSGLIGVQYIYLCVMNLKLGSYHHQCRLSGFACHRSTNH